MLIRLLPLFFALPLAAQSFNANCIQTGKFDYTITDQQKEVAKISIEIRKMGADRFAFSANATAVACQHWESSSNRALRPISALLRFCKDGNDRPMFKLNYVGTHVSGTRYSGKPPAIEEHAVNADVTSTTVDQRIDWAAVMAQELKPGMKFEFQVYDPGTGLSPLKGTVAEVKEVQVPAGRFQAFHLIYQMDKQGKAEHYESFVSKDEPRMLLKIRYPNGTWSELVKTSR